MTILRTLVIDGTDLRTMPGVTVNRMDLRAPGTRRGQHDVIPGRQGQMGNELPYDVYAFSVAITIEAGSEWQKFAYVEDLDAAFAGTNGLVYMQRRIPTGDTTWRIDSAHGQYTTGGALAMLNPVTGQTELQFTNLDGAWYDGVGSRWLL